MNNFTEYLKQNGYFDTTNGNNGSFTTDNTWSGDGQSPMNADSQLSDVMDIGNRYNAGKADRAEARRDIEYLRDAYKEGSKDPNLSNYGETDKQVDAQLQRDYEDEVAQDNANNIRGANAYTGGVAGKVIGTAIGAGTNFVGGMLGVKQGAKTMAKSTSVVGEAGEAVAKEAPKVTETATKTASGLSKVGSVASKVAKVAEPIGVALTGAEMLKKASDAYHEGESRGFKPSDSQKAEMKADKKRQSTQAKIDKNSLTAGF